MGFKWKYEAEIFVGELRSDYRFSPFRIELISLYRKKERSIGRKKSVGFYIVNNDNVVYDDETS